MKSLATWATGILVACAASGCHCDGVCNRSPIAYSDGNPYEIGSGNFLGVGHYARQYGFLRSRTPCSTNNVASPASTYAPAAEQYPAPTIAPVPDAINAQPPAPPAPPSDAG